MIELKSLVLTQKALDKIPVWSKTERTDASPLIRIESIRLDDALIKLDKNSFGPFDARVTLDSQGEPLEALITTQDGKLKASIKPDKSNYLIDAAAKGWKPPVGPPIEFDELIIKGVATLNNADFSQISAKLYGGTVNGKGTAAWQKGLQVKGNFDINQVELKSLVPLVSPGTKMSGRLNAKPVFSASAADAAQLMNVLHLETPFNVQNGICMESTFRRRLPTCSPRAPPAARRISTSCRARCQGPWRAQIHRSQDCFGRARRGRRRQYFSETGAIRARQCAGQGGGHQREYSARMSRAPFESPLLYPTGGTLTGAAIGTVLAPGVGTGVGAKMGQAIEGPFNKKK